MRFVPPVAALAAGRGRASTATRTRAPGPMAPFLRALRTLGVEVDDEGRPGLPFTVRGRGSVPRRGGHAGRLGVLPVRVRAAALRRPFRAAASRCTMTAPAVPSLPHIEMTVETLRDAGVVVDDATPTPGGSSRARSTPSTSRWSPTCPTPRQFLAAALVTGGRVHVPGWPQYTTQAGDDVRDMLDMMGADVVLDRTGLTVTGADGVDGIDVDLHDSSELTPVVAALCALADSPSVIRGVAHLRGHETDRLAALSTELNRARRRGDRDRRRAADHARGRCTAGRLHTYDDHRMAMAAAVLGLVVPGVVVEDVGTMAKTLPEFTSLWGRMLAERVSGGAPDGSIGDATTTSPTSGSGPADGAPAHAARTGRRTRMPCPACVTGVDRGRYTTLVEEGGSSTGRHRHAGPRAGPQGDRRRRPRARSSVTPRAADGALARIVRLAPRETVLRRTADDTDPVERVHRRQRRPARGRHRPGRPRAAPPADRPLPRRGLRRRHGPAAGPHQGRPRRRRRRSSPSYAPLACRHVVTARRDGRHRRAGRAARRPPGPASACSSGTPASASPPS